MLLEHAVIIYASNRAPGAAVSVSTAYHRRPCSVHSSKARRLRRLRPPPASVQSCADQDEPAIAGSVGQADERPVEWFKETDGECVHTPIVTRMCRLPAEGLARFDIVFLELSNPYSITVADRMIEVSDIFRKRLTRRPRT